MTYDVILADPPWTYEFSKTKNRRVENHYPTMALDEIIALAPTVASWANPDSVLFLWATPPKLKEALLVMEKWGYEYKTHCIWNKKKIGMGYWVRGKHELLLIGTTGKMSPPAPANRWPSIMEEPRTRHSKKPEMSYAMIEAMFPNATRLEMFARSKRTGWEAWGLEVTPIEEPTC